MTGSGRTITVAVLAAGGGTRMGAPKAELRVGGWRLIDRVVDAVRAAGCPDVVDVVAVVRAGADAGGVRTVVNADPARGQRSSLQLAIDEARGSDALAVLLVDTPGIDAASVRTVLDAWTPGRIAVGSYGGQRGHPTVMDLALWQQALALAAPDEGARAMLHAHPELVDAVVVGGDPADLDTPEDVVRWERR